MAYNVQNKIDVFGIVVLVIAVLAMVYMIIASIYFFNLMNMKPPGKGESTFLFWTTIVLILVITGLIIYSMIHIFNYKSVSYTENVLVRTSSGDVLPMSVYGTPSGGGNVVTGSYPSSASYLSGTGTGVSSTPYISSISPTSTGLSSTTSSSYTPAECIRYLQGQNISSPLVSPVTTPFVQPATTQFTGYPSPISTTEVRRTTNTIPVSSESLQTVSSFPVAGVANTSPARLNLNPTSNYSSINNTSGEFRFI